MNNQVHSMHRIRFWYKREWEISLNFCLICDSDEIITGFSLYGIDDILRKSVCLILI